MTIDNLQLINFLFSIFALIVSFLYLKKDTCHKHVWLTVAALCAYNSAALLDIINGA